MGLSVCVSVKSNLTYGTSVRLENAVTYSVGNEGQNICGVFSEDAPLLRSSGAAVVLHTLRSLTPPSKIGKGSGEPRIIDLCDWNVVVT